MTTRWMILYLDSMRMKTNKLERDERLAEIAWNARTDFSTFLTFITGVKIAPHQREWDEHLQFIGDNPDRGHKVLFIAPPGAGKSTVMSSFLSWMIGRYPEYHYGLISFSQPVATSRSLAVRKILDESMPYRMVFPGIKKDPSQWNKSHFRVKREDISDIHSTLLSSGANGSVIGARFNGLLYDDPHDEKNSDKSTKRLKIWNNYNNSLHTRVVENGWQVFIGTRWADDDFIGRLSASGLILPDNVVFIPALNSKGESYWPEQYPLYPGSEDEDGRVIEEPSKLWSVRANTPEVFYLQYMGDTTGGKTAVIRKVTSFDDRITIERGVTETGYPFVKVWKGDDHKQGDRDQRALLIGIGIDTALKKGNQNDFTVGYVGGLDRDGNIWVLDRIKGRFGTPELVEEITKLYEKWMPYNIWIEDSAQGTPAVQTLQAEMPYIPTETVPIVQGGSYSRANSLTPYLHKGQIRFPIINDWYEDTRYQLTHFGHTEHDDDVDALFVLCDSLLKVRHPGAYSNRPRISITME